MSQFRNTLLMLINKPAVPFPRAQKLFFNVAFIVQHLLYATALSLIIIFSLPEGLFLLYSVCQAYLSLIKHA